jgi:DNA-binding transcriptional LysR family regulator
MNQSMIADEMAVFARVVEANGFTAAARKLQVPKVRVSRAVAALERALGARLLERTTRRVALTSEGREFLAHAERGLAALRMGVDEVEREVARRAAILTVACIPTVASALLPRAFGRLAADHPELRLRMLDEGAPEVLRAVQSGEAELGLSFTGASHPEIDFQPLLTEDYVLALRTDHPLAGRPVLSWRDLLAEPMVAVAGDSGNRVLIDQALSRLKQRPVVQFEANHIAGALGLVEAGLGVAVVPRLALSMGAGAALVGVSLKQPRIERTLGLITRQGRRLGGPAQALVQALQSELATQPGTSLAS